MRVNFLDEFDMLLRREVRRLRRVRLASEVSQAELARRVGISESQVFAIEKGRARPSTELLEQLATALEGEASHLNDIRNGSGV